MTMFHKRLTQPSAPGNHPRSAPPSARNEVAPALFRLLSDSALYRAAMSASRVPLALLDAGRGDFAFTFINPAFERLIGYAERDVLGRPASLALGLCGDKGTLVTLLELADSASGLRAACRVRRRDATECAVLGVFDAVRDNRGRVTHWIVALDDAPGEI